MRTVIVPLAVAWPSVILYVITWSRNDPGPRAVIVEWLTLSVYVNAPVTKSVTVNVAHGVILPETEVIPSIASPGSGSESLARMFPPKLAVFRVVGKKSSVATGG
jgi:hypothetical protein